MATILLSVFIHFKTVEIFTYVYVFKLFKAYISLSFYTMFRNFPLFCVSLIGRDDIYSSVLQSEYTPNCHLRCIRSFYF